MFQSAARTVDRLVGLHGCSEAKQRQSTLRQDDYGAAHRYVRQKPHADAQYPTSTAAAVANSDVDYLAGTLALFKDTLACKSGPQMSTRQSPLQHAKRSRTLADVLE